MAKIKRGYIRNTYTITTGGDKTTDEALKPWVEEGNGIIHDISQVTFPLFPHQEEQVKIEIIDHDQENISLESALPFLLDMGLEPPTYEHAIRFAEQHGKTYAQGNYDDPQYIMFFHDPRQLRPDEATGVIMINLRPKDYSAHPQNFLRALQFHVPMMRFAWNTLLAGVRPK